LGTGAALETGILAGTALAGGAALPGIVGGAVAPGAFGAGIAPTGVASLLSAPTTAALSPEIAANLAAASTSPAQAAISKAAVGEALKEPTFQSIAQQAQINSPLMPQITPTANVVPVTPTLPKHAFPDFTNPEFTNPAGVNPYIAQPPVEPVSNSLLDPSQIKADPNFKLATQTPTGAASNVVTEGGAQVANKSGMTGNVLGDLKTLLTKPNWANIKAFANENPYTTAAGAYGLYKLMQPKPIKEKDSPQYQRPYSNTTRINPNVDYYRPYSGGSTAERTYFTGGLEAQPIYRVAEGGLMSLAAGGTVETMSAANAVGQNMDYPQAGLQTSLYSNPMMQRPVATDVINTGVDTNVDPYTGEERMAAGGMAGGGEAGGYKYDYNPKTMQFTQLSEPTPDYGNGAIGQLAQNNGLNSTNYRRQDQQPKPFTPVVTGGIATPTGQVDQAAPMQQAQPMQEQPYPAYQTPEQQLGLNGFYDYMNQQLGGMGGYKGFAGGGMASLGGYSDGGRLLRGPGDGVSDSIPASIGNRQPARLADGEFVIPARIVSEIGNGSTEAGARKLYAMMERVQGARKKSIGKGKVAVNSKAERLLPA
jgi:hypothetical protein